MTPDTTLTPPPQSSTPLPQGAVVTEIDAVQTPLIAFPSTRPGLLQREDLSELRRVRSALVLPGVDSSRCGVFRETLRQYGVEPEILQSPIQGEDLAELCKAKGAFDAVCFGVDGAEAP